MAVIVIIDLESGADRILEVDSAEQKVHADFHTIGGLHLVLVGPTDMREATHIARSAGPTVLEFSYDGLP